MKATPFSSEHYYPLVLASGSDAVLINYDGSNFVSQNGHRHTTSHQGAPMGWYKMSNSTSSAWLQPLLAAGVQVVFWGAPAEPRMYEQVFDPSTATVTTTLSFIENVRIRIESFMTSDSIWCEKVTVLSLPEHIDLDLSFEVCAPTTGFRCMQFRNDFGLAVTTGSDFIECDYTNGEFKGRGLLQASRAFDSAYADSTDPKRACGNGKYTGVKEGFTVSRTMVLVGDEENIDFDSLKNKAALGFDALHAPHKEEWQQYFAVSDIDIPDQKIKDVYDMCRYINKSHQHPIGLISLGMLPNHWNGGIACGYDQSFVHDAFLSSGNFKESKLYTDSYLKFADVCRDLLKEHGIKGTTFYGWTACDGRYVTDWHDRFDWITKVKPMFSAFSIIAMYNEWLYHPEAITEAHINVIKEQLLFYTDYMLIEEADVAYIREVYTGTEGGFAVKVDTMTQSWFAAAFQYAAKMLSDARYLEISNKMYAALKENCDEDGMLRSYKGAEYIGAVLRESYRYLPQEYKDIRYVDRECEANVTPFGIDNDFPFEEYRHWPWNDSKQARMYIRKELPEKAMRYIEHIACGCSSLGVLPEKTRLDGYPINYYYTSPSGLAVAALNEAFACDADSGAVILAGGIAAPWKDFSCKEIRVSGNVAVSFTVKNGRFTSLSVRNDSAVDKEILLHFNKQYVAPENIDTLSLKSGQCFDWKCE